mmetsp:Transcript_200/g.190  ORF Transcript_200/g.190 Transcript_200/m.190 type:complete len:692 (-) Transcript_200:36-2111(-)
MILLSYVRQNKLYCLFIWLSIAVISVFFILGTRPSSASIIPSIPSSSISTTNVTSSSSYGGGPLPFNDINILVVTDVHSWVASQKRHKSQYNVDYGMVVSFYEQLIPKNSQQNLFFVMNGDFMDGTGLSTHPPEHLVDILKKMPFDAINVGNHELYFNSTVEFMKQKDGFAEHFGDKYVTSNVFFNPGGDYKMLPLGGRNRYHVMEGPSARVLVFGFLYDMVDHCPMVVVERVEETVEQEWFRQALQNTNYDAILCLSHMDVEDDLIYLLLHKIRSIINDSDMPIHFITGHTHYRGFKELNNGTAYALNKERLATSFEAGHYLDTIGFLSFDRDSDILEEEYNKVDHVFIEANFDTLSQTLGTTTMDDFMTPYGREVQKFILQTEEEMGLNDVLGCSPQHYFFDCKLSQPQSLWRFYMEKVINNFYFDNSPDHVYVMSSGSFRYDLYEGDITLNDIKAMSPWNQFIIRVTTMIEGMELIQMLGDDDIGDNINNLMGGALQWQSDLPPYIYSRDTFNEKQVYELYTNEFDLAYVLQRMSDVLGEKRRDALVNLEYQNTATTDLFIDFISEKWQPHPHGKGTATCQTVNSGGKDNAVFFILAIAFSVIFVSLIGIREVHQRKFQGYNQSVVNMDPEYLSDAAAAEIYSSDDELNDDDMDLKFLYGTKAQFLNDSSLLDTLEGSEGSRTKVAFL